MHKSGYMVTSEMHYKDNVILRQIIYLYVWEVQENLMSSGIYFTALLICH